MTINKGFGEEELRAEKERAIVHGAHMALASEPRAYEGLTMLVSADEAKRRLQQLQAFVSTAMVAELDYGVIPGTDRASLLQPGAQKLAEIYGFSHRFCPIDTVKDWEHGFFYFEFRCELRSRRDGALVCEGIGSCNSRESKYAGRWVFASEVPAGVDRATLKRRGGISKKNGRPYELFLVPNDDIYSIVNTIQKMAAKRAYVHAVISATRSAGIFTQDLEDLPREAFGLQHAQHDPETGEVGPAAGPDDSWTTRLATAASLDALRIVVDEIGRAANAKQIKPGLIEILRGKARERKRELTLLEVRGALNMPTATVGQQQGPLATLGQHGETDLTPADDGPA